MSNEKQTIHEFDLNVIYDYFSSVERQGPGSQEITLKALGFIDGLTEKSKVADIGCGTGGQTMVLAQNIPSEIIGIDLWSDYINQFNQNAQNKQIHRNGINALIYIQTKNTNRDFTLYTLIHCQLNLFRFFDL